MNFRCVLLLLCLAPAWSSSAAVPPVPAKAAPELRPLLSGHEKSLSEWKTRRADLLLEWGQVLGELPRKRVPLQAEFLYTETMPGFTRQYVRYLIEPGVWTDGYLLRPTGPKRKRLPGVVVFHPTTPFQARGVAGLAAAYPAEKWHGVHLVTNQFVVWCPRNFINTDDRDYRTNAAEVLASHPGWTGMARMTLDAMRAADFMETLPGVDRFGCLGHSLGAKVVLYAMAFDPRYEAGVFSEGGIGLSFSNWDAPWYLGEQIHRAGFEREHHELLALAAPRPLLVVAGNSADDDRSGAFVGAALPIYRIFRAPHALRFLNHGTGHAFPAEAQAAAWDFLQESLH